MKSFSKTALTTEITAYLSGEIKTKYDVGEIFYVADSLRLRPAGYAVLELYFESYKFKYNKSYITPRDILKLSRHLNTPFFLTNKELVLFSGEDSVMLKLCAGVDNWLEML